MTGAASSGAQQGAGKAVDTGKAAAQQGGRSWAVLVAVWALASEVMDSIELNEISDSRLMIMGGIWQKFSPMRKGLVILGEKFDLN